MAEARNKLIWLASYPKSGNTWIRLLLSAYLHESDDINCIQTAVSDTQGYYYDSLSPSPNYSKQDSIILRPAALMHMAQNGASIIKTHNANAELLGIRLIPPYLTQKAVYIVRDPRDVAISVAKHYGQTIEQAIDAMNDPGRGLDIEHTLHYLSTWSYHVESWSASQFPILIIRYEDLLSDTGKEMERLLPFLDIDPDPERIEIAVDMTRFEKLQKQEESKGFKERSEYQDKFFSVGRSSWRDTLTNDQVGLIEAHHAKIMAEYGYLKSDN